MSQPPVPQVPYGDPQPPLPEVPYGGTDPQPGAPLPKWLRGLVGDDADAVASAGVPSGSRVLAEPPREVPPAYRMAALSFGAVGTFVLLILALAPMALWILYPHVRTAALVVGAVVVVGSRVRRYVRQVGILRWGRVATVTTATSRSSSTSYTNVPMRQARGWDVSTRLHTGGGTTTEVGYLVDGQAGTLTLRGLPYVDGVVLADTRNPARAMVVSQFPHSVKPGIDGRYVGRLSRGRWFLVVVSLLMQAALVVLAVQSVLVTWVR